MPTDLTATDHKLLHPLIPHAIYYAGLMYIATVREICILGAAEYTELVKIHSFPDATVRASDEVHIQF